MVICLVFSWISRFPQVVQVPLWGYKVRTHLFPPAAPILPFDLSFPSTVAILLVWNVPFVHPRLVLVVDSSIRRRLIIEFAIFRRLPRSTIGVQFWADDRLADDRDDCRAADLKSQPKCHAHDFSWPDLAAPTQVKKNSDFLGMHF